MTKQIGRIDVETPDGHVLIYRYRLDRLDVLGNRLGRHAAGRDAANPFHRLSWMAAALVIQEARRFAARWLMS
jgi:hypothetical protein